MADNEHMPKEKQTQPGLFDAEPSFGFDKPETSAAKGISRYKKGQLYQVMTGEISPNPDQPRRHFGDDDLAALAESITANGLLQPVLCSVTENGLVLAAGERRLRAARMAGIAKIPVRIVAGDPVEIALIENLLRQDLTVVEEAEAISALKKRKGYRLEDLTSLTGKAVATLSEILAVTSLPEEILDECRALPSFPRDVLVLISRLSTPEEMIESFRRYRSGVLQRQDLYAPARKTGKTRQVKRAPFRFVRSFTRGFRRLDLDAMEQKEREDLRRELEGLMEEINKTLSTLKP